MSSVCERVSQNRNGQVLQEFAHIIILQVKVLASKPPKHSHRRAKLAEFTRVSELFLNGVRKGVFKKSWCQICRKRRNVT